MKGHHKLSYFTKNLVSALGLIMVWRGIWIFLDKIDYILFNGSHILTAIAGVVIGLLILYIPDRDLKEIERL